MIHGYCASSSALIVIAALAAAPKLLVAQATRDKCVMQLRVPPIVGVIKASWAQETSCSSRSP